MHCRAVGERQDDSAQSDRLLGPAHIGKSGVSARALITEPTLVLADEPTANIDSQTGKTIIDLMHNLSRERGTTFIFSTSTHDPKIMERADRVVHLKDGVIEA